MPAVAIEADDLYERLGVDKTSSIDDIKRAYRVLLRRYPPERAPEEFKRIREAYETLSNPRSRQEYDERLDPIVERWMATAFHSMTDKNYPVAERYFKQVLLKSPDLGYVRNMLGLCLFYRGEWAAAAAQFERLLPQPDAPAAWFGNVGHAYRALKRYGDAERAFTEAARRATDDPVDYYVGLADVLLDENHFAKAAAALERGINVDGKVDFQDLRYFTKLLEVRLRERSAEGVATVLHRISEIAAGEEQRRLAAWRLGSLAIQLVSAGGFTFAMSIASTARQLAPADKDYVALETAARLMRENDFAGVNRLIASHPSFSADEWLHDLAGEIRRYCTENRVLAQLAPITTAPTLYTINGIGTMLYGQRDTDVHTGSYVATLYFTFLFIPLFPIACYRVIQNENGAWSFLGKVPYSKREARHWVVSIIVVIALISWNGSDGTTPVSSTAGTASSTQFPSYNTNTTNASSQQASALSTSEPTWYTSEKRHVDELEAAVQTLDADIALSETSISTMNSQIAAIENGNGSDAVGSAYYRYLIDEHNTAAREHNATLYRRRAAYASYETALNAFNQHVDAYNASNNR